MTRFRIPTTPVMKKDYKKCPWIDDTKTEKPMNIAKNICKTYNISTDKLLDKMFLDLHYDRQKSAILVDCIKEQGYIVRNDNEAILTINIPLCAWRCFNCKRVMYQQGKCDDSFDYYYDSLLKEINVARDIIKRKCYIVKSVCYTGNLLALDLDQMEQLLSNTAYSLSETCVEIGNPAFVTREKLALLKKYNVSRVIINAMTFNMATLRKLCRRYEFKDFYQAYRLIAEYGLETNIELVVGMLGEHELQVKRNLEIAMDLGATNIDLYARSCPYNPEEIPLTSTEDIVEMRKMLEFCNKLLKSKGYNPYFVYNTEIGNGCFENVGYTIHNKNCIYKTDTIEEISTIIGCGTDAKNMVVKNLHNERKYLKNTYDMGQYILGIDEILEKKKKFFA